jgi:hypothetical protein
MTEIEKLYEQTDGGPGRSRSASPDAMQRGDKQAAVQALLKKKPDVNAAQSDGATARHWLA